MAVPWMKWPGRSKDGSGPPPKPKSQRVTKRERARAALQRKRRLTQAGAAAVVVAGLALALSLSGPSPAPVNTALSQHVTISIIINGTPVVMLSNIGVNKTFWKDHSLDQYSENASMAAIHTHNTTGIVHIYLKKWHACYLSDFFSIWGRPFDNRHLLNYVGPISMSVNGHPDGEFGTLLLQDGQVIVLSGGVAK